MSGTAVRAPGCGVGVVLEALEKSFGERRVLQGLDLSVAPGEFVTVVGRSGCGKSTLLRLLGGLEEPSAGSARIVNDAGHDAQATLRIVFQEPRLLPWRSVLDNVRIGITGGDAAAAREALASVGLADRATEYPGVLSGGQKQRVALARALVHEPCVMLLDEPFGALDALTRIEAQRLVERLWLERGFTALLVTHDVGEAVLLGDRVVVVEDGRLVATFDVPVERPRRRDDPTVASLTGQVLDAIFGGAAERAVSGEFGRAAQPRTTNDDPGVLPFTTAAATPR
jgi:sulfonate transport system ATP-binding protein